MQLITIREAVKMHLKMSKFFEINTYQYNMYKYINSQDLLPLFGPCNLYFKICETEHLIVAKCAEVSNHCYLVYFFFH